MDKITENILNDLIVRVEKLEADSGNSSSSKKKQDYKDMPLKNPDNPATSGQLNYLNDLKKYLGKEIPNKITKAEARELIKVALANKSKQPKEEKKEESKPVEKKEPVEPDADKVLEDMEKVAKDNSKNEEEIEETYF